MPEQGPRMNGFSLGELCWLFCCPPCPSRIAAKLAFLPPEPTYTVMQLEQQESAATVGTPTSSCSLHLTERADWQYSQRELDAVEVFFSRTARDNRLGCMFVRCAPSSRYTLLFSHGNAVDLGQMCSFYIGLGSRINCNVFSYDYSGYGVSTGKPSEKNLYADIDAAWQALRTRYGVSPENIILYGQSIGTVPTVDLASRIDKISKVTSPVLVIHGTEDEVIDFSHGLAMYERCPRAVEPLWVEGAGHNDIELYAQYLERLKQFISHELPNS
ncbi:alpha/beta hydrolase domain-containing protein 17C isoform X2 [Pituophis catenifer annectens]|uniref:alpha/beta hydrolase domain-containing protein 17C isoform X2 n=1 Tax=Pituophis catenifer annectens TaxID=94852 RepID=UPI0039912CAB